MFEWFKRRFGARAPERPRARAPERKPERKSSSRAGPVSGFGALPVPEVVNEGNTHADWSMWEDSMAALDSQMPGLSPSARVYERSPRPSQFDEVDAFARVGKNSEM